MHMRAIICTLAKLALRHYRDPLSWAGIITAVGAAAHVSVPPEYVPYIETLMGAAVGMLLLAADGRKNPNTEPSTGAISERVPDDATTVVVVPVQAKPEPDIRSASATDIPTQTGHRPPFGPY